MAGYQRRCGFFVDACIDLRSEVAVSREVRPVNVLLVEDDLPLGSAMLAALENEGFVVTWLRRIAEAGKALASRAYDVAIVDVQLPDGLGYTLCIDGRNAGDVPVIFMSVRDSVSERIHALDSGADDYIVKPFAIEELLSRIRVITRRRLRKRPRRVLMGSLDVDFMSREVLRAGRKVSLTEKEFRLLSELALAGGRTVRRSRLEDLLSRNHSSLESNALDVHMYNLRKKLGCDVIHTVRSIGYRIDS